MNVSDIPLDGVIPYIILVTFVFFVPIVLANLINGLAISDIAVTDSSKKQNVPNFVTIIYNSPPPQVIKAESELIGLVQRVSVIYKLETALEYPKVLQTM